MNTNLRRLTPLAILIAIALFPFGWLASLSSLAAEIGSTFFPHELARGIGHSLLFATLAVLLLRVFPALLDHPIRFFALVLIVAIGQESFQLLYKQRGVALNDLTDILIDLTAAGLVFALWYSRSRRTNYDPLTGCRR
jgi:hypothetical protein